MILKELLSIITNCDVQITMIQPAQNKLVYRGWCEFVPESLFNYSVNSIMPSCFYQKDPYILIWLEESK